MDTRNQCKWWELALGIFVAVWLVSGMVSVQAQEELAQSVVRLHVLANSDSEEDQGLKLQVRDEVLSVATSMLEGVTTQEEALARLETALPILESLARDYIQTKGYDYAVTAELELTDFPTKYYDGFSLPAGEYVALRILIGEAQGQNWWCVVFPPLCTTATSEVAVTAMAGGLEEQQVLLMTESQGYELRFKAVELWGELRQLWDGMA